MRFRFKVYYALPFEEHSEDFKWVNARTSQQAMDKFKLKYPYFVPVYAC